MTNLNYFHCHYKGHLHCYHCYYYCHSHFSVIIVPINLLPFSLTLLMVMILWQLFCLPPLLLCGILVLLHILSNLLLHLPQYLGLLLNWVYLAILVLKLILQLLEPWHLFPEGGVFIAVAMLLEVWEMDSHKQSMDNPTLAHFLLVMFLVFTKSLDGVSFLEDLLFSLSPPWTRNE